MKNYGHFQVKPASAKNKGREFQKKVVQLLLETFPELAKDDITSRSMGAPGEDILLSPKARMRIPFSIECKHRASIAIYAWLEQRLGETYPPIVFAKANHKEPLVVMFAEDFLKLIKRN